MLHTERENKGSKSLEVRNILIKSLTYNFNYIIMEESQ